MDTGASLNFINEKLIDKVKVEELESPMRIELANGEDRSLTRSFETMMKFEKNEISEYKLRGYIVEGMKEDIILGMPFLMNNDAEIYCKNGLIKIDDIYLRVHKED